MPAGRPRAFEHPDDLDAKLRDYFAIESKPTMAGICVHLDICKDTWSAYGLGEYDTEEEKFSDIVKKARLKVESVVEAKLLHENGGAGQIFWLKNHAQYRDQSRVEHTGADGGPIEWTVLPVAADPSSRKAAADPDDT